MHRGRRPGRAGNGDGRNQGGAPQRPRLGLALALGAGHQQLPLPRGGSVRRVGVQLQPGTLRSGIPVEAPGEPRRYRANCPTSLPRSRTPYRCVPPIPWSANTPPHTQVPSQALCAGPRPRSTEHTAYNITYVPLLFVARGACAHHILYGMHMPLNDHLHII